MEMVDGVKTKAIRSVTFPVMRMPGTAKKEPWENCAADVTINFTGDLEKADLIAFFSFLKRSIPATGGFIKAEYPEPQTPPEFNRPERVQYPARGDKKLKAPSDVDKVREAQQGRCSSLLGQPPVLHAPAAAVSLIKTNRTHLPPVFFFSPPPLQPTVLAEVIQKRGTAIPPNRVFISKDAKARACNCKNNVTRQILGILSASQ